MPVTINGTTGISGVDGSAGIPAVQGTDTNTGIAFPAADTVSIATSGTERLRVDSSGYVGVNTTAPAYPLDVSGTANVSGTLVMGSSFLRNRIINGDMRIDQRNAGASVTPTDSQFSVDRWKGRLTQSSKFSLQQSSTAPTGHTKSILATSLSAYSVLTTDFFCLATTVEGLNMADLGWGASGAQSITLSFWVRSSLTGTFGGAINNSNGTRNYPFTYTISSANTWEQKTVVIPGDTSGTWNTDNSVGMTIYFSLGAGATLSGTAGAWSATNYVSATGATSVVGTNAATWYITGVQLEVGTVATPFERRLYGQELALCQRYYYRTPTGAGGPVGWAGSTTTAVGVGQFPVRMRTTPTALEQSGTAADYSVAYKSSGSNCTSVPVFSTQITTDSYVVVFTTSAVLTAGEGVQCRSNTGNGYLGWSAEL